MQLPEYVALSEVQRVCRELGFRDWTLLTGTEVLVEEARVLQAEVGGEALQVPVEDFQFGLEVELEHGMMFPDANVTNNHPLLIARIVLAHLKEMLDYYSRLEVAELEGDMLKALVANDSKQLAAKYDRLIAARLKLSQREARSKE